MRLSAAFVAPYTPIRPLTPSVANGGPGGMLRRRARHVDDPALAALEHRRQDRLGQVERRVDVDLEHQPPAPQRVVEERVVDRRGGVVDEDVDRAAEQLDRGRDDRRPAVGVGQVGDDALRPWRRGARQRSSVSLRLPARWSCWSTVRAVITTSAPSAASRSAVAAPMPRLAPVTTARRPRNALTPRLGCIGRALAQLPGVARSSISCSSGRNMIEVVGIVRLLHRPERDAALDVRSETMAKRSAANTSYQSRCSTV